MYSKVFSPIIANRFAAAQKFPQLLVRPKEHERLTHHRELFLPLSSFEPQSVDIADRELEPGRVVEIRQHDRKLIALGFFEPQLGRVDVFDVTPRHVVSLPTISEDFFLARVHEAWERRRSDLHQTLNNTYRVCNGYVDGLPSLFIDIFSESFVRVMATSAGAERLVPAVVEFMQRRGAEDVLLDTPQLGCKERLTLVAPTIPTVNVYVEGGIRHLWLKENVRPGTITNRHLLNPAHRRTRRLVRDLGRGKRVLCVNDRSGSATLNALLTAKKVTVVEKDDSELRWLRDNLVMNHSPSALKTCDVVHSGVDELTGMRTQDVVYLEHHAHTLATKAQWRQTLTHLMKENIIGVGTTVIMAQEAAPLGVIDYLPRRKHMPLANGGEVELGVPARRAELAQTLRDTADELHVRVRFLRAFSSSIDYPLLPEGESVCFSLAFLVEGPAIE